MYDKYHKIVYRIFLVIAIPFGLIGCIYGVVLLFKRDYRREGGVMIAWSLITISLVLALHTYLRYRFDMRAMEQIEMGARKAMTPGNAQ